MHTTLVNKYPYLTCTFTNNSILSCRMNTADYNTYRLVFDALVVASSGVCSPASQVSHDSPEYALLLQPQNFLHRIGQLATGPLIRDILA